jgi:hypothetical protein
MILAGAAAAMAVLSKQTGAAVLAFTVLEPLVAWLRDRRSRPGRWWGAKEAARSIAAPLVGAGAASGSLYNHYYLPVILPVSLGCGGAAAWLTRRFASLQGRPARRAAILALATAPWVWPAAHGLDYLRMSKAEFHELEGIRIPFGVSEQVGRYVAARTRPGEPIVVVGSEPQIYYYADRPACSRMVFSYPMAAPYSYSAGLRAEFIADIERVRPRYAVVVNEKFSLSEWPEYRQSFMDEVRPILERDYTLERKLDLSGDVALPGNHILILRRK